MRKKGGVGTSCPLHPFFRYTLQPRICFLNNHPTRNNRPASIVALIVVYVSAELGWRTIQALLDAAPKGLVEKVEQAAISIPGVVDAHAVRIRPSGALPSRPSVVH
ncbi:MAG: hypothetical protein MUO30_09895 [Anaerolineales bacterium]|nr:hypothetical protein [Anaerolineales bacterium]